MTKHVIIGGGPVATNAAETIRQFDNGSSQITLVSDEPAHSRMALPYWLSGQIPREQTHTADDASFKKLNVDARIGVRVDKIDPGANQVTLSDGSTLEYDNLLIATGSSPVELPIPGADQPGVQPLWTLGQTESLLNATASLDKPRVAMIGAGFIGFIMLNAMSKRGWQLSVIEQASHVLPRMLDDDSAGILENWLGTKGVDLHLGTRVKSIDSAADGSKVLQLENGSQVTADGVIVATGVKPNLDLAQAAGIDTDVGILVNDRMQTSVANIYAGGDVAQGPNLFGGTGEIHAIQPTAVDHGRIAGANMAGEEIHYPGSLSMNVLDVCGLQNASFGNWLDSKAEATTINSPEGHVYRKFLWSGDEITGAIFVGQANDLGMLTDVGMVKGMMQTRTKLGAWKDFLKENPFDVRRPYVATNVAQKLAKTTLLGRPAQNRVFRYEGTAVSNAPTPAHADYVGTKSS